MNGVIVRSLSGIVYMAVIICGILLGPAVFQCFLVLFAVLALVEFYRLTNHHAERFTSLALDVAGGVAGVLGLFAWAAGKEEMAQVLGTLFIIYLIARLVLQLYTRERAPIDNLAYGFMGQLYIVLPLGLMSFVKMQPLWGGYVLLAMFVMIWLNDTGAFCVGSLIGRHKLFERVSPKKSWEGFVGGMVFAIAGAVIMKQFFSGAFEAFTMWQMVGMGVVVSVFATWGDLVESLIKRTLGVKDSGHLIPGHGGILDRIDSLLLVSPALLVYLIIIM